VTQAANATIFTGTEGINFLNEETMRIAISVLTVLLVASSAPATEPQVRYYVGEAKRSSDDGKSLGSEVFLAKRTVDRDNSTITEQPIILDEKGKVTEWTIRFTVKEDGTFTIEDDTKITPKTYEILRAGLMKK
jgi:hypothetical protein